MYTDGSVSSVDDLSFGWDDEEGLPTNEKKKIFFEFIRRLHSALILPICYFGLDEVEYAALKALCVWKMGKDYGSREENWYATKKGTT